MQISKDPVLDQRTYNVPTAEELAVIWTEESATSQHSIPYIVVHRKSGEAHRIIHYYGCYDALQYPLIYPYGACGWH